MPLWPPPSNLGISIGLAGRFYKHWRATLWYLQQIKSNQMHTVIKHKAWIWDAGGRYSWQTGHVNSQSIGMF